MEASQMADVAEELWQCRMAGNTSATLTGPAGITVTINLEMLDRCEEFARLCFYLVEGIAFPAWAGGTASDTEDNIRQLGYDNLLGTTDSYPRGSVMFWNLEDAPPVTSPSSPATATSRRIPLPPRASRRRQGSSATPTPNCW